MGGGVCVYGALIAHKELHTKFAGFIPFRVVNSRERTRNLRLRVNGNFQRERDFLVAHSGGSKIRCFQPARAACCSPVPSGRGIKSVSFSFFKPQRGGIMFAGHIPPAARALGRRRTSLTHGLTPRGYNISASARPATK